MRTRGNRRNLYGVFYQREGRAVWGLRTRQDRAKREAQRHNGYCMVLAGGLSGAGQPASWDAPTFRVTADLLVDYRRPSGGVQ